MKIAAAQSRPIVGPVEGNLPQHERLIELALHDGADLIVFPELSLTGYEPRRAVELSRTADDSCFDRFQAICDGHIVSIGVGVPLQSHPLPHISFLLFRPHRDALIYSKRYLHPDECPYFKPGPDSDGLIYSNPSVALAICYELSIPQHAQRAVNAGATAYIASAAKSTTGIEAARRRLSEIARESSMLVMLSNCLGALDGAQCVGHSSVWDRNGRLLAELDAENAGVIVLDCETEEVLTSTLSPTSR